MQEIYRGKWVEREDGRWKGLGERKEGKKCVCLAEVCSSKINRTELIESSEKPQLPERLILEFCLPPGLTRNCPGGGLVQLKINPWRIYLSLYLGPPRGHRLPSARYWSKAVHQGNKLSPGALISLNY